ncbi:MAG: ATP-dependent nuclease subunit B [Ruminococcaceae bacterium]|nr:ATP-dependent nuclease subunit B [Oscillospiraceae bacterium]
MVKLIIGRAGSGKTSAIINEIHDKGLSGDSGMILIVPEQFSHDTERELSRICGAGANLYSEVLSFSRLSNRVLSETGGFGIKPMDQGGRLLLMSVAVNSVRHLLKTYRSTKARSELLNGLLMAWDEFSAAGLKPVDIQRISEQVSDNGLSEKLWDMSMIFEAYLALMPKNMCDPFVRLELMAENLDRCTIFKNTVYIDGFTDFTYQQLQVIKSLMKTGTDVTFALTCDSVYTREEVFRLSRDTLTKLVRFAKESGHEIEITVLEQNRQMQSELRHLERNILCSDTEVFDGECEAIELYKAASLWEECELAASRVIGLVRDEKLRWRDIGVVVRDFQNYSSVLESVFSKYGVPVMNTGKSDILAKPVMTLITSALDIAAGGWEYDAVFRYLKTELTDIDREARDALENYVLKWNIRGGRMWMRNEPWTFHPRGFNYEFTEADTQLLDMLNEQRCRIAEPFKSFEKELKESSSASGKAKALYGFLVAADVPQILENKVRRLREKGEVQLAGEYLQLWDIIVTALEQFADVLGDMELTVFEFRRLFTLLLSQYQVGTIPMSLDRVSLGDMSKMRRRGLKCLIVLGATDDALPKLGGQRGLLSDVERDEISSGGMMLNDNSDTGLLREYNLIYSSLTLPSEKLIMSYPGGSRPSFILTEIENLFGIECGTVDETIKENAPQPCFELAVTGRKSAREYFSDNDEWSEKLESVTKAAETPRGKLSKEAAERLYSKQINLSASRVDKFHSCRFMYFMEYGLRAKPRQEAKFDAPAAGTFMHYILENVAKEAEKKGGFGKLTRVECSTLTKQYVSRYVDEQLGGFTDKSARFVYLFNRLAKTVEHIVADMASELSVSDFRPLDFELSFASDGDINRVQVTDGDITVNVNGKVDRVDGWVHDDKLYLRVVDYKTGKKSFNLSDVWYGMGLQMLIYLFALERHGTKRYGKEIIPAGVLYAPASDIMIQAPLGTDIEEIEKERAKKLVRKGLILSDPDVLNAMEHEKKPKYLPVKINKSGEVVGDSLCSAEQLGSLAKHIDGILLQMAKEMGDGSINADPYYRGPQDNACTYCRFYEACHFDESTGDKKRYIQKLKTSEVWERLRNGD